MGKLGQQFYQKKFEKLLTATKDEELFELVWAVNSLQNGRAEVAARYLQYPPEAATDKMDARCAIHPWELETLVNQRLMYPKWKARVGKNKFLNYQLFGAAAALINCLRKLENAESGIRLSYSSVFNELPKIGYRQFHWQRGFFNAPQFYRSAFIYGQGECREYFEGTFGLTFNQFSLIGFAFYATYLDMPALRPTHSIAELGVTVETVEAALKLLSLDFDGVRKLSEGITLPGLGVAHQPSAIRQFPIVRFGSGAERLRAPLPDLILMRITSGVYYDLVRGGQRLLNDASDRFEQYCRDYISTMLPKFHVVRSEKYQLAGSPHETVDVRIHFDNSVAVAIECKATKLTFLAQFGEDPLLEAKRAYDELAKAIFQIWRYFSHARRGVFGDQKVRSDAHGLVLTLDSWLVMTDQVYDELIRSAENLAKKDPEITEADRRAVAICSIETLESTLTVATEETFLGTLGAATEHRFKGWLLFNVYEQVYGKAGVERKPFPFELDDVLPWWKDVSEIRNGTVVSDE